MVLWSHFFILLCLLAAKTVQLHYFSYYFCEMILLTMCLMVWYLPVLRARPMVFHWPKLFAPCFLSTIFPFSYFPCIGWYCGAGVFGLIGCQSLSSGLALTDFFNINFIVIDSTCINTCIWQWLFFVAPKNEGNG